MGLKRQYELRKRAYKIRHKWEDMNRHNHTSVGHRWDEAPFPLDKVHVGNYTYGSLHVTQYSQYDGQLYIGHFCSIAPEVRFLLGGEHDYRNPSSFPFKYWFTGETEAPSKGDIIVEDDVWIGTRSLILSGVTLARGTVVAAGSVVVKSTEPYSIVGGNPAHLIKKRFSDETIAKLMQIDFSKWDEKYVLDNMERLYTHIE